MHCLQSIFILLKFFYVHEVLWFVPSTNKSDK